MNETVLPLEHVIRYEVATRYLFLFWECSFRGARQGFSCGASSSSQPPPFTPVVGVFSPTTFDAFCGLSVQLFLSSIHDVFRTAFFRRH